MPNVLFKLKKNLLKLFCCQLQFVKTKVICKNFSFVKTFVNSQNFSVSKRALRENWEGCHDKPDLQFIFIHLVATIFWLQVINWKTKPAVSQLWTCDYDDDNGDDIRDEDDGVSSTSLATLFHVSHSWSAKEICQCHWMMLLSKVVSFSSLDNKDSPSFFCPKLEFNTSCLV